MEEKTIYQQLKEAELKEKQQREDAVSSTGKVGRPKAHGIKSGISLVRAMFIQGAFIRHRQNGTKYEFAIAYAMDEWLTQFPRSKISVATVKRILAETMPEGAEEILIANKPEEKTFDAHGRETVLTVKDGVRPEFLHPSFITKK